MIYLHLLYVQIKKINCTGGKWLAFSHMSSEWKIRIRNQSNNKYSLVLHTCQILSWALSSKPCVGSSVLSAPLTHYAASRTWSPSLETLMFSLSSLNCEPCFILGASAQGIAVPLATDLLTGFPFCSLTQIHHYCVPYSDLDIIFIPLWCYYFDTLDQDLTSFFWSLGPLTSRPGTTPDHSFIQWIFIMWLPCARRVPGMGVIAVNQTEKNHCLHWSLHPHGWWHSVIKNFSKFFPLQFPSVWNGDNNSPYSIKLFGSLN